MMVMRIWSNAFKEGERIPPKYTCDGENVNPPLAWDNVPPETKSLALVMDDPDAPMAWVHWVVVNIDPKTHEIPENFSMEGMKQIRNSARKEPYHGPCPPTGTHRYYFKLFAVDVPSLDVDELTVNSGIAKHTIATAVLMGRYERIIGQMTIWSNSFKEGEFIPPKYTCEGENVSPHLAWGNVPEDTKSFVLVMDDPDSPVRPFVHWIMINIDPKTREIPENTVPPGASQVFNSAQKTQYFGPCPYASTHHYNFRLYALKVPSITVNSNTVFIDIQNTKITEAVLTGLYFKRGVKRPAKRALVASTV